MQKTVLLALDERNLTFACLKWTFQLLSPLDTLVVVTACTPIIPAGRSSDGFGKKYLNIASIRRLEMEQTEKRLMGMVVEIMSSLHLKSVNVSIKVGLHKLEQADYTLQIIEQYAPDKIILFLDTDQQPWLSRIVNGDMNSQISSQVKNAIVLNETILRKLDDRDIFGAF